MRAVGALTPARSDQPARLQAPKHRVQQQALGGAGDQACSELAEDGKVEPRVLQLQSEGVFPIDAAAHGRGGLAVGQALGELQHGDQRQPPRR